MATYSGASSGASPGTSDGSSPPPPPRIFMDPVHGSIELDAYLVAIIDTPEFQRLRRIKQLGGACYVYPGATHTRFEHSIGVCHIASELIKGLNKPEKRPTSRAEPWINKEEEMCIKIAALCHDIGHGPYSHLYDVAIGEYFGSQPPPNEAHHEYRSAAIVKYLLLKDKIKKEIEQYLLPIEKRKYNYDMFVELIQRMITFSEDFKEKDPTEKDVTAGLDNQEKSYLFEIVANGFTGIDVDKMDYFARDSRSVGLPNNFDWRRYIQTAMIIKCPKDKFRHHICSREKDAMGLYELFHTRTVLFRTVYRHKTVIIIEHMIQKALITANLGIKIRGKPLLECWKDMDMESLKRKGIEHPFFYLTDSFIEEIIFTAKVTGDGTTDSILNVHKDISEAKKWFERLRRREIPKFFTESRQSCEQQKDTDEVRKKALEAIDTRDDDEKYIISKKAKFSYGKGKKNPMEVHHFYHKWNSDEPKQLPKKEVSAFLPEQFQEVKFFWYCDIYKDSVNSSVADCHLKKLREFEYFKNPDHTTDENEEDS